MPIRVSSTFNSSTVFKTARALGLMLTGLSGATSVFGQDITGDATYGSVALSNGFLNDPQVIAIQAGGGSQVDDLGASCVGYINASQPDVKLEYEAGSLSLGIFVRADTDTTLVINAPNGRWYCDDDSTYLESNEPALLFEEPQSGTYTIWVGSYDAADDYPDARVVITEWDPEDWLGMALDDELDGNDFRDFYADGSINFGDDSSTYANDDECDDPRFSGSGVADTLLESDRGHDATDCRTLFNAGAISLVAGGLASAGIDFGDDSSNYANDDECDDPRFAGPGVAATLLESDRGRDASDCRALFNAGSITLASADAAADGIDFGDDASTWASDGECDDPRFQGESMSSFLVEADRFHDASDCRTLFNQGLITLAEISTQDSGAVQRGNLGNGDDSRSSGAYADSFSFEGEAGQSAVIDMRSGEFDTYLILRSPSGSEISNDDYGGSMDQSLISSTLAESGTYQVLASSYGIGETGGYTLEIDLAGAMTSTQDQNISGQLASGDSTFSSGEFYDSYEFEGRPGQRVNIELESNDFDTYLVLNMPSGESEANDDGDSTSHSQIQRELSEAGTYSVSVTSYAEEERGNYTLSISFEDGVSSLASAERDVVPLTLDQSLRGSLSTSDSRNDEGKYEDVYSFSAESGDSISVEMNATGLDTYLSLITPSGEVIENDDYQGSTDRSRIELTLPVSGRYRVIVSSYGSDETGDYSVALASISSASFAFNSAGGNGTGGQIYGIFAGIADYPGTGSDLSYTDQDAIRARDALIEGAGMPPGNATTLIDSQATIGNLRSAIQQLSSQMGENDTFVLFYSGHGSRVPRAAGFDSSDPDGMDETIEMYDGSVLDDELNELFDTLNAGTILLVMDSCFSGGFSKDIISRPGRMGLFSSEEDVTSQVAVKFQAGGYLSVFFDEAIRGGYADRDDDGELTAIELSQYLHDRYRADVKSSGASDYVRTGGPQGAYQHLVVDRGGVAPYSVLFSQ